MCNFPSAPLSKVDQHQHHDFLSLLISGQTLCGNPDYFGMRGERKMRLKEGQKKKTLDIQTHLVEKQSRLARLELFLTSPGTVWMGLSQLGG